MEQVVIAIDRILDTQVDPAVAANLRIAGGGAMIWERVVRVLIDTLSRQESDS
jgi:hypothetical protein